MRPDRLPRVLGGVLVGGQSRRMHRPKQLLTYRGRTLLEIVSSALEPHVEEVLAIGDGALPRTLAGMRRLPDPAGVRGPLAGILAALRWSKDAAWVLAPCDLPRVRREAVAWLLSQRRRERWAILPHLSERGIQPLLAVYEPASRPLLEDLLRQGHLEPRRIAGHPAVVSPRIPPELAASWFNANTPADLATLSTLDHP